MWYGIAGKLYHRLQYVPILSTFPSCRVLSLPFPDKKYHVEHLTCSICPTLFGPDDSYYEHDGDIYCHYHYSTRFATKCSGCGTAILKQSVEINRNMKDECWHPECYMINKVRFLSIWPNLEIAYAKAVGSPGMLRWFQGGRQAVRYKSGTRNLHMWRKNEQNPLLPSKRNKSIWNNNCAGSGREIVFLFQKFLY